MLKCENLANSPGRGKNETVGGGAVVCFVGNIYSQITIATTNLLPQATDSGPQLPHYFSPAPAPLPLASFHSSSGSDETQRSPPPQMK